MNWKAIGMNFNEEFKALTGNLPFPWQEALFHDWFSRGEFPSSCNLPTGLGKTSVVGVWLLALAHNPRTVPRRLVYVVNRRTVVDQTTAEVENYRSRLASDSIHPALKSVCAKLEELGSIALESQNGKPRSPLALSTLRGQFADNREWSADPSRPAVIVGTVDMIGSRLLFSGYGIGFKSKPLHAGFLGQDSLLIHDEAHLEPAFQKLLVGIEAEQKRSNDLRKLRVMELSATSRATENAFSLSDADRANPEVTKRINATKNISLHALEDDKKLADRIVELARQQHTNGRAVLIFMRKLDDVEKIVKQLPKESTQQLTGTLRGYERDRMVDPRSVDGCPIFARFLKPPSSEDSNQSWKVTPKLGTVYLVCTSAGEVGVNISADHMICDLSTFESMAQRFGRVNRFGSVPDTQIDIVYPMTFGNDRHDASREATLRLFQGLDGDGSPQALGEIPLQDRLTAYAPVPEILSTSPILFDAWSLTTIKGELPGRPPVEPYLHGIEEIQAAETHFAWREEVTIFSNRVSNDGIEEFLDVARIKPHELLRLTTFGKGRAYDQLQKISQRHPDLLVWVIKPDGTLHTGRTVADLVAKKGSDFVFSLASCTVVLPPQAGGLNSKGTLNGDEEYSLNLEYDVAGLISEPQILRLKLMIDAEGSAELVPVSKTIGIPDGFRIELTAGSNRLKELNSSLRASGIMPVRPKLSIKFVDPNGDDGAREGVEEYLIFQQIPPKSKSDEPPAWPDLQSHLSGVQECARSICRKLNLDPWLTEAIELSGAWHDLGKGRSVWQRGAGNDKANLPIAKPVHGRPPENLNHYRHELGSLIDVCASPELAIKFDEFTTDQRAVALQLIGAHHGRARPYFPANESGDGESPESVVSAVTDDVPVRFARLQSRFGRWGLAFLESILRSADVLDSQRIDASPLGDPEPGQWTSPSMRVLRYSVSPRPTPSIQIKVDTINPGQFFACCGLFELAENLWAGAEAWFESGEFRIDCGGSLAELLDVFADCRMTNAMTPAQHDRFREITAMSVKNRKATPGVENEYKELDKLLRESFIVFDAPFRIIINWFTDEFSGGSRFKTWAGRQSVLEIATSMKEALKSADWRNDECLRFAARKCGLPFNFDSDLGGQGGALDLGFSFDPLADSSLTRIETMARPALELLAFIGLQRFRPSQINGVNQFRYTAWNRPLPIQVAVPAACGVLPIAFASRFEFRLLYRTKYLKSFLPAVPFSGVSDD